MERISHDLAGLTQRLGKSKAELQRQIEETQQIWKDENARQFFQQQLSEIAPAVNQLVSSLTQAIELYENISKKVQDPERA